LTNSFSTINLLIRFQSSNSSDGEEGDSTVTTEISGTAVIEAGEVEISTDMVVKKGGIASFTGKGAMRLKKGCKLSIGDGAGLSMNDERQTIKGDGEGKGYVTYTIQ